MGEKPEDKKRYEEWQRHNKPDYPGSASDEPITIKIVPDQIVIMEWNPQEDITAYELAKCLPFLMNKLGARIPYSLVDLTAPYMRHFEFRYPLIYADERNPQVPGRDNTGIPESDKPYSADSAGAQLP